MSSRYGPSGSACPAGMSPHGMGARHTHGKNEVPPSMTTVLFDRNWSMSCANVNSNSAPTEMGCPMPLNASPGFRVMGVPADIPPFGL